MRPTLLLLTVLVGVVALPATAGAWDPLQSCGGGTYTHWPANHAEWRYATNFPSGDFSEAEALQIITDSMEEWGEPGCSDFTVTRASNTTGDPMWGNSNEAVGFYQWGWPASLGSGVLAVTFPSWNYNCELTSATIAMNEQDHNWVAGDWGNDAQSVMTHEVGHYVGLDHSSYWDSTMTSSYNGGTGDRTLSCDDTEAACALYPSGGTACGAPAGSDYCPCGQTCQGGWCNGVESGDPWGGGDDDDSWSGDDDDAWPDDDDDDGPYGDCDAPPETASESEPNDWDGENDYDAIDSAGGDLTVTASLACGNNGNTWTSDVDWFVVDFPCADSATFTMDWSGGTSDLDFWVYDENTDLLTNNMDEDYQGPVSETGYANGRVYIAVACWSGPTVSYTFEVDFAPSGWTPPAGDDDDDAADDDDAGPSDDDDSQPDSGDDDDAGPGPSDDDDGSQDNAQDDGELDAYPQGDIRSVGCGCASGGSTPVGVGAWRVGLLFLGGRGRRRL